MKGKLPHHTLHNGDFMAKVKFKKIPTTNRLWMDSECIICMCFSKKKKRRGPPPPMRIGNTSPVSRISELWRQNYMWRKNQQAIGKNGLRMHHLHPFFKNFLGETRPPPYCERIKTPLFGFIWSSTAIRWKFSRDAYIEDRSFERKNYTQFFGENKHELGKNGLRMHHLHPFFKKFPGATWGRGYP